ncbi:alpha-1,2-fucosyltransferase [Kamptonema sp. UHCC 0994]|uniref:alpha-1,2-fucosyltransferase n=1 Tax=Kamptonema sp. UHCC 0994 TaxID=3031329 RepID=UPI0023B9ED47|nr:alpha-1,2-fucosyltransferase [Kamptonema sp. UHCC 0994]MDF0553889.1 alpha-1,2-fucosyltransferase [Kamptonema sp. UHCC 0994]
MLIISAKSGLLGNRLLLFANFIAFAIEHNLTVLNPAFEEYAEFFVSTASDFLCCYPPPYFTVAGNKFIRSKYYNTIQYLSNKNILKTQKITREKPFNFATYQNIETLKHSSIICFQGWVFRDGWFVEDVPKLYKYADRIRAYFKPLERYTINVNNLISNIKNSADIIIGVHIRQGDYVQHQRGRYFYKIEQYLEVMNSVVKLFEGNKIKFLICSNIQQDPSLFDNFNCVFANDHLIEDMYALAECDYIVGPPSTYSMWASFYGDKPLYTIRDVHQAINLKDFVHFYEWQGVFNYRDNWNESFWEWTH